MIRYLTSIFQDPIKANQFSALFRFGISLLISVLLVRSHFTKDEVGSFEYLILITLSLSFFWTYAYSSAMLSKLGKLEVKEQNHALVQILYQLLVIGIVMAIVCWFMIYSGNLIDEAFTEGNNRLYISIYVFFILVNPLAESIFILRKKAKQILSYNVIIYLIQLTLVLICIFNQWPLIQLFYAYFAWQAFRLLFSIIIIKPDRSIDWKHQRIWFLFSLPLVLHFILGSGMDYLDGHIVSWFYNEETFLYYRYGARELPFSLLLINALSASMIPVLSKNLKDISELKKRIHRLARILFPISAVFLFISPFLYQWVYGKAFIESALIFNIYILIISSRILVPHLIMYAKEDNRSLMYFSGLELVLNFILSIIFIQYFGYYGVAFATVIAFLFNRVLSVYYCRKKYGVSLHEYLPVKHYLFHMTVLFVSFAVSYQLFFS